TKALCEALRTLPAGIGGTGIFVREERGTGGKEVIIYSFHGSRFNRVLAHLAKGLLGRVQVGYDDERVWVVRAGKTGAAERVTGVIRKIPHLTPAEIAGYLPLPSPDLCRPLPGNPSRSCRMQNPAQGKRIPALDDPRSDIHRHHPCPGSALKNHG